MQPLRGAHLMLDLRLAKPLAVAEWDATLRAVVAAAGMTIIAGPECSEDSGFVVLAESHAVYHAREGTCFLDLFSCKPFNLAVVTRIAMERLGVAPLRETVVERQSLGSSRAQKGAADES